MKDISLVLNDVLNKIILLKCSNYYLHDNVSQLSKDDFVNLSYALQNEILELEKKIKLLLDNI